MNSHAKITINPSEQALEAIRESWNWLLGSDWKPILFSAIGDVFVLLPAKSIWWLSTATGDLEQVASHQAEFTQLLDTELVDEWFLPGLVHALIENGQSLNEHECYSYRIFPIFEQGSFSVENMFCLNTAEHFSISGQIHRQLRAKPDGSSVQILIG